MTASGAVGLRRGAHRVVTAHIVRSLGAVRVVSSGRGGSALCGLAASREGILAGVSSGGLDVTAVLSPDVAAEDADAVERWAGRALAAGPDVGAAVAAARAESPRLSGAAGAVLLIGRGRERARVATGPPSTFADQGDADLPDPPAVGELAPSAAALRSSVSPLGSAVSTPHAAVGAPSFAGALLEPAAAVLVVRHGGDPPFACVCLGPPVAGAFIPVWPGVQVGPELAGGFDGPPLLGALAAALGRAIASGAVDVTEARARLDAAEAGSFSEAELADDMARRLDGHGDDVGATVRRVVATAHCVRASVGALRELLSGGRAPGGPSGAEIASLL